MPLLPYAIDNQAATASRFRRPHLPLKPSAVLGVQEVVVGRDPEDSAAMEHLLIRGEEVRLLREENERLRAKLREVETWLRGQPLVS